jgi:hypothetical protein
MIGGTHRIKTLDVERPVVGGRESEQCFGRIRSCRKLPATAKFVPLYPIEPIPRERPEL